MNQLRTLRKVELSKVAEVIDRTNFLEKTFRKKWSDEFLLKQHQSIKDLNISNENIKLAMTGGMVTYHLQIEARIASFLGKGFYTIGPCGEELLGFISLNFKDYDLTALHYRHLANSIVRQLQDNKSISSIILDRARGYTVSTQDPVTAGKHCSIGGNPNTEYIVTSTLSSQAPPAVGRALAIPYSNLLLGSQAKFNSNAISYVSLGDGSLNNAHFLSALNLSRYSEHSKIKCPVVFAISDNKICISLKGNGYVDKFVERLSNDMFVQVADGRDVFDLYAKSKSVIDNSRTRSRPSLLLVSNLPRRFGHAATDRQFAYYTPEEIQSQVDIDPLSDTFSQLLQLGIYNESEIEELFNSIQKEVEHSFDVTTEEVKINSRKSLVESNSAQIPVNFAMSKHKKHGTGESAKTRDVMRKHMTKVFDEILENNKEAVYVGEDVQHGGYYLVTEGLHKKFPLRVRDFPPDETSLVGAAMGFAQSGLVPVLEIPYGKYLDCAADMFHEAIIMNWLSNGKQPNGMIVRLQGFDKGIFGGNYHTHNHLTILPGLDVVCFSNGKDYVRGMRFLYEMAKLGRVVMSVDSTDLLNRRHLEESVKDERMLSIYPEIVDENYSDYSFDEVTVYQPLQENLSSSDSPQIVIVSYGNGIPTSLLAQKKLQETYPNHRTIVIDTPFLSGTPSQLIDYFKANSNRIDVAVFADVCKEGPGMPLSMRLIDLQNNKALNSAIKWKVIGASPTYNPLGSSVTFLSTNDILSSVDDLLVK